MKIHREGTASIIITLFFLVILNGIITYLIPESLWWISTILTFISFLFLLFIISFFRIPTRKLSFGDHKIIAPADGKVVVIEEVIDKEYFQEKRLQVSIFMSPLNVHVNRYPVSGEVVYNKYHKGKYLVAWDPKSSTDNERQSIVIKQGNKEVLVKQIAGALAKRICNYAKTGTLAMQNDEFGFIKFGSRVDLLLPIDTKVNVQLNEVVKGGVSVIAEW